MSEQLPHDDYAAAVVDALTAIGIVPDQWWTETADGQQLDAVIMFSEKTHDAMDADAWPSGSFLGWDQRQGWSLVEGAFNRTLYPLDLDTYAAPAAVAQRARDRLLAPDEPDKPMVEAWDGAVALQDAVERWEANS